MAAVEGSSHDIDGSAVSQLPRVRFWEAVDIFQWGGFWFGQGVVKPVMYLQTTFKARDDDVLLATPLKTGTTWLKALCLCILKNPPVPATLSDDILKNPSVPATLSDDILVQGNPHFNVQTIEAMSGTTKPNQDLYTMPSPRLYHTHSPYQVLPDSIKGSHCKIVYIARNPKDTVVSLWHFFNSIFRPDRDPYPLQKAVDCFCSGMLAYGPFFDHVLEFWKQSRRNPTKILFLKYEDLKKQPQMEVKKLAEFLGKPFASDSEVDEVLRRCSLERLRELEVNKKGSSYHGVPNSLYFRRGVVGDWKNFLTPEMEQQINETTRVKFEASGLHFDD